MNMDHDTKNHDMNVEYYLLCKKINQSEKNVPPITKHGKLQILYEDLVRSFSRPVIHLPKTEQFQDSKYFRLIPTEIRSHIPVLKSRSQYTFTTPGGRNITVCIACYHDYVQEHADMVQQIYSWFCFLEKHARPICSKNLTVYLYLTKCTKILPKTKNTEISEINVNSGFTIPCPQYDNEIYIYRYEEWFKVFLHETIHALGIDFSWYRNQAPIENILRKEFTGVQTTQWNISECYTEVWAEICNILIQVYRITKKPKFAQIQFIVQTALMYESCWSRIQCSKVLQHYECGNAYSEGRRRSPEEYGIKYQELKGDVKVYQETDTSVFTYYVLKSILMTHLDLFLDWCSQASLNNPMLFTKIFDDEKTIESRMISFGNFLVQMSGEMDHHLTKKNVFSMNSMRMSLWG
uniref:Uncharacterized protein n=1 Tax=viral metagenome TaxID=1070528 RepID=A0A6C0HWC3_9ZZZZ